LGGKEIKLYSRSGLTIKGIAYLICKGSALLKQLTMQFSSLVLNNTPSVGNAFQCLECYFLAHMVKYCIE